ncbi:MAG: LytTR family transcriptional regulator [Winogradskyella sp.]|uniref:LytR/AlgR family response regulator transcription factor n=1 Tax=Winogradskyella sp. TaxID=1883156 RepID=UPI000F3D5D76|nr:LytTR family DNA-binding domain-containing protein [Winogradskyella sp.]RNC83562.1 MAG: LytTR family transcriptional regulator [Winogradskyella sp.]
MSFLNYITSNKRIILLIISVLLLTITFETSQQLYYLRRFNLGGGDATFLILLKSQAYRWFIWMSLSLVIVFYARSSKIESTLSVSDILKYCGLILSLVTLNIVIISISQVLTYGDPLTLERLFNEYLPFFMFQKAPMYTLGYIAITIITHLYFSNERLQIKIQNLSELKLTNARLYAQLKDKVDDKTSVLNIKIGNKRKIIPVDEVLWIEADDYCVKVHTIDKGCYTMRSSLKALLPKLDTNFLRVHRKAIANMRMIKELSMSNSPNLILSDNTEIPVSKTHLKTVKHFLSNH